MLVKKGLIFICIVFAIRLSAQVNFTPTYSQNRLPCDSVVYHINLHSIKQDSIKIGSNGFFRDTILPFVNQVFAPICISFELCEIDTFKDYNYNILTNEPNTSEENDILSMDYNPYVINVYWNEYLPKETFNGICKDASKKPAIFVARSASWQTLTPEYFAKQVLRYFGMPNTSSYAGSEELVNASNATVTADSIWDTPADPYRLLYPLGYGTSMVLPPNPEGPASFTAGFKYVNHYYFFHDNIRDANNEFYNPILDNLMSSYNFRGGNPFGSKCPVLTRGQYQYLARSERRCREIRWK